MRNSTFVYPVKREYVHKVDIFGLKMMVKSGLEKVFWNSSMRKMIFLLHENAQNCKFSNTNGFSLRMDGFQ